MSASDIKNTQSPAGKLAVTAILLAICIASQFLKSLSVYITGPIVNLCLILAVMSAGLLWGELLALITPVTAFIISPSPVMQAVPGIIPLIMLGNSVLVFTVYFIFRRFASGKKLLSAGSVISAVICAAAKGVVMGLTIALWLLPTFIPAESPLMGKLPVFQTMFSVTQFVTALIGFVYFFVIWKIIAGRFVPVADNQDR